MSHAVHYRDADGDAHLEDVATLDEALETVERLRNEAGVDDVRVFKEVPIEVRTYYKVLVAGDEPADAEVAPTPVAPAPSEPPAPASAEPAAASVAPKPAPAPSPPPAEEPVAAEVVEPTPAPPAEPVAEPVAEPAAVTEPIVEPVSVPSEPPSGATIMTPPTHGNGHGHGNGAVDELGETHETPRAEHRRQLFSRS